MVAPGYSFLQDVVSRALGKERGRLTRLLDTRLDEATRKALDRLYLERDGGYRVTPLKQDPKDFSRSEMRREWLLPVAGAFCIEPRWRCCPSWEFPTTASPITRRWSITTPCRSFSNLRRAWHASTCCAFFLQRYQRINDNLIECADLPGAQGALGRQGRPAYWADPRSISRRQHFSDSLRFRSFDEDLIPVSGSPRNAILGHPDAIAGYPGDWLCSSSPSLPSFFYRRMVFDRSLRVAAIPMFHGAGVASFRVFVRNLMRAERDTIPRR